MKPERDDAWREAERQTTERAIDEIVARIPRMTPEQAARIGAIVKYPPPLATTTPGDGPAGAGTEPQKHKQEGKAHMSDALMRITVEGIGHHGLLMHNPAGMAAASQALRSSAKKIPPPEVEAAAALYIMPPGGEQDQLYAAADWFREAGLIAAKEFRDDTRPRRATMERRFGMAVFLSDPFCPLTRASTGKPITADRADWEIYMKRVVVQRQGVVRARALVHDWACTMEFEYETDNINPEIAARIINGAGKFPGVGDYRPSRKGPFGRYRVTAVDGEPWEPES